MKIFNENEKSMLKSAFLEYAMDLPCDEDLKNISFSDGFDNRMAKAFKRQKTLVLRRAVAVCACLAVIVTAVAFYQKPDGIPDVVPPQVENESEGEGLIVPIENTIENIEHYGNEFFVAKIITNPKITEDYDDELSGISQGFDLTPTLCTAKVTKAIATEMVSDDEKIKIFNYVYQLKNSYSQNLEKGKTYLLSATIEPHNQSAVAVCTLVAELDGDTLLPKNSMTEKMFLKTKTLTEFLENEYVKKIIDGDIIRGYPFSYHIIKTKDKIYTYQNDREYFIERIKESLKPHSKKIFTRINRVNDEFYNDLYYNDSVFTAKVVGRERELNADSFADSEWIPTARLVGTPALYHVEIQDNMWSFFEGSPTVKLVFYENTSQLEIGKTYLFSAQSLPFENSAVLVETQAYTAKVDGKKLIPITETSKFNLEGLDTFKKLKNSNNFLALTLEIFTGNDYPNNSFEKYIAKQGDTTVSIDGLYHPESDYYNYQKIVAEAIKVGSDVTITKMEG